MIPTTTIHSIEEPCIRLYRNLNGTPEAHIEESVIVLEGHKSIEAAFAAGADFISFVGTPDEYRKLNKALPQLPPVPFYAGEKKLIDALVGFSLHRHLLALVRRPAEVDIHGLSLPAVLLHDIVNSENVGAIARTAAAFGIPSLLCNSGTSSPFLRRAVRVSMGAMLALGVATKLDTLAVIDYLRSRATIIGIEQHTSATPLPLAPLPADALYIFGSEGRGLPHEICDVCDALYHIPLSAKSPVNSLNVAATAAIILQKISS